MVKCLIPSIGVQSEYPYPWPKGWGPGWPNCDEADWVDAPTPIFGKIHKDVHDLVEMLIAETELLGYHLKGDGVHVSTSFCWGADCRPVKSSDPRRTTDKPSIHSLGTAVDLNSADNGYGDGATYTITGPVVRVWALYGFMWGEAFHDYMHMQFMGTPDQAKQLTVMARKNRLGQATKGVFMALDDDEQKRLLKETDDLHDFVKGARQADQEKAIDPDMQGSENYMAGYDLVTNARMGAGSDALSNKKS